MHFYNALYTYYYPQWKMSMVYITRFISIDVRCILTTISIIKCSQISKKKKKKKTLQYETKTIYKEQDSKQYFNCVDK
jgi:hypothetical protein